MGTNDSIIYHELIKALFSGATGLLILGLGWFVGQKLTYQWNVRQKRREFQLLALQQFYLAYGEFFAVWKLWNRLDGTPDKIDDRRWELHKRAAAAEAIIEGTLVKLTSELVLDPHQLLDLGCFRQSFQQLRQSIRKGEVLPWIDSEDPPYRAFKTLSARISAILGDEWPNKSVSREQAADQLLNVTSNSYEKTWIGYVVK